MWLQLIGQDIRLNIVPRDFAQDYPPLQGFRLGLSSAGARTPTVR